MATTTTQTGQNYRVSCGKAGDLSTITRTFVHTSDGLGGSPTTMEEAYRAWPRRPKLARLYLAANWGEFIMANLTFQKVENTPQYSWIVTETFSSRHGETCMAKVTRTAGTRNRQVFRQGATLPANALTGGAFPPTSAELITTGTKVDMRGTPLNVLGPQITFVVETMYESRYLHSISGNAWPNYEYNAATYMLKRNSVSFMGLGAGSVVFLGMDENEVDDLWRICAYRFVWDKFRHLEQRVYPEVNGKPLVADSSTFPTGDSMMHASKVYWYQPYPDTADLYDLFTQCVKDELVTPSPALLSV